MRIEGVFKTDRSSTPIRATNNKWHATPLITTQLFLYTKRKTANEYNELLASYNIWALPSHSNHGFHAWVKATNISSVQSKGWPSCPWAGQYSPCDHPVVVQLSTAPACKKKPLAHKKLHFVLINEMDVHVHKECKFNWNFKIISALKYHKMLIRSAYRVLLRAWNSSRREGPRARFTFVVGE